MTSRARSAGRSSPADACGRAPHSEQSPAGPSWTPHSPAA